MSKNVFNSLDHYNISPDEMLNDSVMKRDEVINYILDDFRIDLNKLKKIIIYKYRQEINKPNAYRIAHHRRNMLFKDGELSISPFDGALKIKHIIAEIQIIESYLNKKLECEVVGDNLTTKILQNAIGDIITKLGNDKLKGIIIGSIWNINFLINHKIRKHMYAKLFKKFDKSKMKDYISHRLKISKIEDAFLKGELQSVDSCIFQEGRLPTKEIYNYVNNLYKNLKITEPFKQNQLLQDYLALDYVFFNDLQNGTKIFDESTKFPETQIFSNNLLTYQIINFPHQKEKYLNITWLEPTILGYILEKLQTIYGYDELLMYGKCGALEASTKVGSIVAPKSILGKQKISIANNAKKFPLCDFINVDSPLMETKTWLKNALALKAQCVEMELYDIFKRIKSPLKIDILYYVSDNLNSNFKLSNRFDFLKQRLFLANRIVRTID